MLANAVRFSIAALLVLCASGCGSPLTKSEPTPIRLDAPQRRAIVVKTTTKQTMGFMGQSVDQTFEEDQRYTLDIDAASPDGAAAFTSTLDFFSLEMESGLLENAGGGMDPATMMMRPMNEVLRAARGLSYTGTLSRDGRVQTLDGLESLREEVHKKLADRTLPPELIGTTLIEDVVEQIFNEESTREGLEGILLRRPLEPLTEGVTWTGSAGSPFGTVEIPASVVFTVSEATPEGITVKEVTNLTDKEAAANVFRAAMGNEVPAKLEVSGSGSGAYSIDPETGWVQTHTSSMALTIRMEIEGAVMVITTQVTSTMETFSE